MRYAVVRYSTMHYRGNFLVEDELELHAGRDVLVRSPRGLEHGLLLGEPREHEGEFFWAKGFRGPEAG